MGDELIATGLARGAANRGKLIAFGDGRQIVWSTQSREIFRGNPNIAHPGQLDDPRLEWIAHYRGCRLYGEFRTGRWHFRPFQCPPGEVFLTEEEEEFGALWAGRPFAVIEPRVKARGASAGANKQWPHERYQKLAELLASISVEPVQFVPPGAQPMLRAVRPISTQTFRHALAVLQHAAVYIGPEGGLHHGAAAVGTRAVVIWGGFNTPKSTGYPYHSNLVADGEPCGRFDACDHCRESMASITVDQVFDAARWQLVT